MFYVIIGWYIPCKLFKYDIRQSVEHFSNCKSTQPKIIRFFTNLRKKKENCQKTKV